MTQSIFPLRYDSTSQAKGGLRLLGWCLLVPTVTSEIVQWQKNKARRGREFPTLRRGSDRLTHFDSGFGIRLFSAL